MRTTITKSSFCFSNFYFRIFKHKLHFKRKHTNQRERFYVGQTSSIGRGCPTVQRPHSSQTPSIWSPLVMLSQNNHIFGYKPTVQPPCVGVRKSFLVGFQKAVSGFVMLMAGVVGVVIIIVAVKSSLGIVMHGEGWEVAHIALLLNMSTARQSNVNGWNDVATAVHYM